VLFSVLAFLSKLALALATSVGLMALNEAGFVPAEANTPHALGMLALLYALIPCAVKTLSCFLLWPMLSTERISHETPLSPFPYRSDPHV
jgi:Na+/melibiose symporter-like transporter